MLVWMKNSARRVLFTSRYAIANYCVLESTSDDLLTTEHELVTRT
jgi:hypothetical protein